MGTQYTIGAWVDGRKDKRAIHLGARIAVVLRTVTTIQRRRGRASILGALYHRQDIIQ